MRNCRGTILGMLAVFCCATWGQLQPLWMQGGVGSSPNTVVCNPQRDLVAVVSESNCYIHRLSEQRLVRWFSFNPVQVSGCAFSPDGELVAVIARQLRVWRVSDWSLVFTAEHPDGFHAWLAMSPDSRWIAAVSGNRRILVWSLATGALACELQGHTSEVLALRFHPTEPWLYSLGRDGLLRVWRIPEGSLVRTQSISLPQGIFGVVLAPDVQTAAITGDVVRVVSLTDGRVILSLSVGWGTDALAYSWDSRLLAAGSGHNPGRLYVWRVRDGTLLLPPFNPYEGGDRRIFSLGFAPDNARLVVGGAGQVAVWDLAENAHFATLPPDGGTVPAIMFTPDSQQVRLASRTLGRIRAYDAATGVRAETLLRDPDGIASVAFHPDGTLVATSPPVIPQVRLWSLATGEAILTLPGNAVLGFSPDGSRLWAARPSEGAWGDTIRLWRLLPDGAVLERVFGQAGVTVLDESRHFLFTHDAGQISVWDAYQGVVLRRFTNAPFTVDQLSVCPYARYVACRRNTDHRLYIWQVADGVSFTLEAPFPAWIDAATFTREGVFVAGCSRDGVLRFWNLRTRTLAAEFSHPLFGGASSLVYSPDGRLLAVGAKDALVAIFRNPLYPDLNQDNQVDDAELLAVLLTFGATGDNLPADFDRDGRIDENDLFFVLFYFGR